MLLSGAKTYRQVWQSITESELTMESSLRSLFTAAEENGKIEGCYQRMRFCNRDTILSYGFYAYWVKRDVGLASSVLKDYAFHELDKVAASNVNNITLQVSLEAGSLGEVLNCSANVSGKLGYSKKHLTNSNLDLLVPSFCRESHTHWMQKLLQDTHEESVIFNLKKQSVCVSSSDEYI